MSKTIKFTEITKREFKFWCNDQQMNESVWEEVVNFYEKEVENFIDYITETLIEDQVKQQGIFTKEKDGGK